MKIPVFVVRMQMPDGEPVWYCRSCLGRVLPHALATSSDVLGWAYPAASRARAFHVGALVEAAKIALRAVWRLAVVIRHGGRPRT